MRYVNKHLANKVFKFERLVDLADIAEKGDHSVSYDLKSANYHVGLHTSTRRFVGIKWEGVYYEYKCLAFGLSTTPWVFSKVMRELVMYWRSCGIKVLPYLDDLFFPKKSFRACRLLGIRIEGECFKASLLINFPKSGLIPSLEGKHLGFEVDLGAGYFRVPADRWEALQFSTDDLLMAKGGRVQARKLASLVATVISMRLAWGPVCQLYTRHLYALLTTMQMLNFRSLSQRRRSTSCCSGSNCRVSDLRRRFGPPKRASPSRWGLMPVTSHGAATLKVGRSSWREIILLGRKV
jgi:hypothetical protein